MLIYLHYIRTVYLLITSWVAIFAQKFATTSHCNFVCDDETKGLSSGDIDIGPTDPEF